MRVNVANVNFLKQHRDVAIRFAKAYADTVDWMYANPDKSLALYAKLNKIDMKTARQALSSIPRKRFSRGVWSASTRSITRRWPCTRWTSC